MSAKLPIAPCATSRADFNHAFRVVVLYEGIAAGASAMDACTVMLTRLGNEWGFRISISPFEMLRDGRASESALHDAMAADAIMLALRFTEELPQKFREWMETLIRHKRGQDFMLIALLDVTNQQFSALKFLKTAALECGVDFLVGEIPRPGNELPKQATFNQPACEPEEQAWESHEGWGLND